jgi:SagB-type dehydrogenase family enzyme
VRAAEYHDRTKHHFHRFARSAGHLDWSTQPSPFRRYHGAPLQPLPRLACAPDVSYSSLFAQPVSPDRPHEPMSEAAVADLLRCAMGLSAWKAYRDVRWALRVNPSSGNLHPTETYLVRAGRVYHYAPDVHGLEERCTLDDTAWRDFTQGLACILVGFTSISWREAWKYGERAFRYCQHDLGHALAALRYSAGRLGWQARLLPKWADPEVAALLGIDRPADEPEVEPEEAECLVVVTPADLELLLERDPGPLVAAARAAAWHGAPSRLSPARLEWPVIGDVEKATRYPGLPPGVSDVMRQRPVPNGEAWQAPPTTPDATGHAAPDAITARALILQRRSAVAFDASTGLARSSFIQMLNRLQPPGPPWDVLDWEPSVHLAIFVHRVEGLTPGVYAYLRAPEVAQRWRKAMRPEFLWEPVAQGELAGRLFLLLPSDVTWPAKRVSCDQDIAGDGFFSLGMLAPLGSLVAALGEWVYRRLFWECGVIGQVLYLEAEAAGARGTGIGCFYDDAVHGLLGIASAEWQSLYHFSIGMPVEDDRLTTEPGYPWESNGPTPRADRAL